MSSPDFNRLARLYRWLELATFGPFLQRARSHFLPEVTQRRRALVLGDGDGRFTACLLRSHPQIQVHAVDLSPAMLRRLRQAAGPNSSRLTTECADLRDWHPAAGKTYDLVATHFVLDCLTTAEVCALAARLAPALAHDPLWIVSEFAVPQTIFGRVVAGPLVAGLYLAFRLLTGLKIRKLPDYREALAAHKWVQASSHRQLGGLLVSQAFKTQDEFGLRQPNAQPEIA